MLNGKQQPKVEAGDGDEGVFGLSGFDRKSSVEVGHEDLFEVNVRPLVRGDLGDA